MAVDPRALCVHRVRDAALERRYREVRRPSRLAATRTVLAMAAVVWGRFYLAELHHDPDPSTRPLPP